MALDDNLDGLDDDDGPETDEDVAAEFLMSYMSFLKGEPGGMSREEVLNQPMTENQRRLAEEGMQNMDIVFAIVIPLREDTHRKSKAVVPQSLEDEGRVAHLIIEYYKWLSDNGGTSSDDLLDPVKTPLTAEQKRSLLRNMDNVNVIFGVTSGKKKGGGDADLAI